MVKTGWFWWINLNLLCVLLISGFLLFFQLGKNTLTNWDEAWFASVAQDMVQRGDWLGGQWNGEVWFYEPPFLTWILALVMKFISTEEIWLRMFNACCGLGIVIFTYLLVKILSRDRLAPVFSILILLSNIEFLFRGRQINTDIPLSLFLLIVLVAAVKGVYARQGKWLILSATALAVALLTKRVSALLVLPTLFYILGHYKNLWKQRIFYIAMGVLILLVSPWYIYGFWRWQNEFIQKFFLGYTLGKIAAINPATGVSLGFYFKSLMHAFKIWSLLLPLAIYWWLRRCSLDWKFTSLIIYGITFFTALTLIPIKASWYLLPIYPILAIIIGVFLGSLIHHKYKLQLGIILGVLIIFSGQIINWRYSFIVPDTTGHQAKLAILAGKLSAQNMPLYLDDDYLPVAVFYSQKRVIPLRFNRQLTGSKTKIDIPQGAYILTNKETILELRQRSQNIFMTTAVSRDLLLLYAAQN